MDGNQLLKQLQALMRRIDDENRVAMPWVEWARRHPVTLQLSDYAPVTTAYVLKSHDGSGYMVVAHAQFLRAARRATDAGPFPVRDQELAEMIAWQKAALTEPGEEPRELRF